MASEMSIAFGGLIRFSLRIALNVSVPIPTHFDFGECSQLCEFNPMVKATCMTLRTSLMIS